MAKQDCRKDEIGLPRVNLKPGGSKEWYGPAYIEIYKTASFMLSSLDGRIHSVRHRVVKIFLATTEQGRLGRGLGVYFVPAVLESALATLEVRCHSCDE